MWQKIKCWLGLHKTAVSYTRRYGKVLMVRYCIHCKKTISEEELVSYD
jgi:hypothetical protein